MRSQRARRCSSSFLLYDKLSTTIVTCFIIVILIQLDYTVLKMKNELPDRLSNKSGKLKFNPINMAGINSDQYPPVHLSKCSDNDKHNCLDQCKNVTVTESMHVIFCLPIMQDQIFKEGSIMIFYQEQLAVEFTGPECNLLVNWIRACSRSDYAGCIFSYNKLKPRSKECYIKSLLSKRVYMCFDDKYNLIHMSLKRFKLDLSESAALIKVLLKLFQ